MTDGKPIALPGWLTMTLGLLALTLGLLWTLQGLDLLEDSLLSGEPAWTVAGAVLAVTGLALLVVGTRRRNRAKLPA